MSRKKIIVIGAGAAGLMAAVAASDAGAYVTVIEKNEKAGKKIYITGKGRCNFTNACETADFFDHVVRNPKFLYSAVYDFDQAEMTQFLEENGCPTKVERGNRAFPVSDHASDVTRALTFHLRRNHVKILLNTTVTELLTESCLQDEDGSGENTADDAKKAADGAKKTAVRRKVTGVRVRQGHVLPAKAGFPKGGSGYQSGKVLSADTNFPKGGSGYQIEHMLPADAVILATGGLSYPSTGSTGDGYRFAEKLGIAVMPQAPALVPLVVKEKWPLSLQGLSLKNVQVTIVPVAQAEHRKHHPERPVYSGFGEMMFTHFGVTGPLILSASSFCDFATCPEGYMLHLDLKPALSGEQLEERIRREFTLSSHKEFVNAIRPLFPERLTEVVACLFAENEISRESNPGDAKGSSGVRDFISRKAYTFTEAEISRLVALIKDLTMTITGTRGFEEAIITRGGIAVKEINPSTMESRKVRNLYFAGEVIDVNAQTGGFNLQIAWSTGHLAGTSAAEN